MQEEQILETTVQEEARKKREEQELQAKEHARKLNADLRRTINNDSALRVFRRIFKATGYENSNLTASPDGEVNQLSAIVLEARRSLWVELRQHIDRDILIQIEYPEPEKEVLQGDKD